MSFEDAYAARLFRDARLIARRSGGKMGALPKWNGGHSAAAEDAAERVFKAIAGGTRSVRGLLNRLHLTPEAVSAAATLLKIEGRITAERGRQGVLVYVVAE